MVLAPDPFHLISEIVNVAKTSVEHNITILKNTKKKHISIKYFIISTYHRLHKINIKKYDQILK